MKNGVVTIIEDFYIPCFRKRSSGSSKNAKLEVKNTSYVSTSINGYLGSKLSSEKPVDGKIKLVVRYKFYCDDFNLQYHDIINYDGLDYRVIEQPHNCVNSGHHIKTSVERVI